MSATFTVVPLKGSLQVTAPDGSQVNILSACAKGSMARFALAPGLVSKAVRHRTVEELWYFIAGTGEMWLRDATREEIVHVYPGLSLAIPVGTSFQFKSTGAEALEAIGVTMPPWPGMDEAEFVPGRW